MQPIRVFIASPKEMNKERNITSLVIGEINRTLGITLGVDIEMIRWETHAWPDIGDDAQDVINKQIGEFDVFIGFMWRIYGSPTKRAKSGTGEEFQRAYDLFRKYGRPKIMFYFRTTPFYLDNDDEIVQFRKVAQFRHKLEKSGVLYWTYNSPLQFERFVREHLTRQIFNMPDIVLSPQKAIGEEWLPEMPLKSELDKKSKFLSFNM